MKEKNDTASVRLRLSHFFSRTPGRPADGKLDTFLGVFTPTLLTILGVIMYLRVGWLVGNMGLLLTLSIVVLANLVTLTTTLSFSSIATNRRIGIGGAYNIISRNLGLEIGGAIGLPPLSVPSVLRHSVRVWAGRIHADHLAGRARRDRCFLHCPWASAYSRPRDP